MNTFKQICESIAQWFRHAGLSPQAIAISLEERRLQTVRADLETERLDRIRNPSKYLGK